MGCNLRSGDKVYSIPANLQIMNQDENRSPGAILESVYDFSSPLWSKYYNEIRKTVKFPRGYREISMLTEEHEKQIVTM